MINMSLFHRGLRFIVAANVILLASSLSSSPNENFVQKFQDFKVKYLKSYATKDIEAQAFENWLTNQKFTQAINNPLLKSSWTADPLGSKFSDLSADEFKSKFLMNHRKSSSASNMVSKIHKNEKKSLKGSDLPTSFDWGLESDYKSQGATGPVVTSVKDQGSVGSCWAFSTIGNVEGQWALAGNNLIDLSAEYLVDCDGSSDYDQGHADCSVFGGWPYLAYGYLISTGGAPSEADLPYCAGNGGCYPCMQGPIDLCGLPPSYCDRNTTLACPTYAKSAHISSWAAVSEDEDAIAAELVQHGPLSVLLDANYLQFYQGGVWDGHIPDSPPIATCSKTYLDHAVLLTGYGVDADSGTPYWKVKNSWGADWGEEGYFRIVRGQGTCGINTAVTTSSV
jgi:cathepsin F